MADDGPVDVLVEAKTLAALPAALRRVYCVRLGYEPGGGGWLPRAFTRPAPAPWGGSAQNQKNHHHPG